MDPILFGLAVWMIGTCLAGSGSFFLSSFAAGIAFRSLGGQKRLVAVNCVPIALQLDHDFSVMD